MANKAKDLASGTLSSSISASSTSISVSCGSGSDLALLAVWPTTPFYITVMPANPSASVPNSLDSEIMKVSVLNASGGIVNMSVSRGQRGTTAKAFSAGDIVSHAIYAEDAVLLGEEGSSETPSPWITPDMMTDEAKKEIAEDTAVLGYINYTRATLPSGWFPVYKDSAHTTTYPYDEIYDAVEAGLTVVFRTTDNYDMRILGLFSTDSTADYYTVAFDGNTLGMLTYDKQTRLTWHYGAGAVLTDEIADGAITNAKIDFSTMYVSASTPSANINVGSGAIIQTITLPVGKWRVFASFRLSCGGMTANQSKFFYCGFKYGSTLSSTTITQIPTNMTADTAGSGRQIVSMICREINATSSYPVSSYVQSGDLPTTDLKVYVDTGVQLFAIRVG